MLHMLSGSIDCQNIASVDLSIAFLNQRFRAYTTWISNTPILFYSAIHNSSAIHYGIHRWLWGACPRDGRGAAGDRVDELARVQRVPARGRPHAAPAVHDTSAGGGPAVGHALRLLGYFLVSNRWKRSAWPIVTLRHACSFAALLVME